MDKDKILKERNRLIVLFLIYISVAFGIVGFLFYKKNTLNGSKEFLPLTETVLNGNNVIGQYIQIESNTFPILMIPAKEKGNSFYFIKDINNHVYIVSLSTTTFKRIMETFDFGTGESIKSYQVNGEILEISEDVKNLALANESLLFKNEPLTSNNFENYLDSFIIQEVTISQRMVIIYTIFAFIAFFFLVLSFFYVLPTILKLNKEDFGDFSEDNLKKVLQKYLPDQEHILAGVRAIGLELAIKRVFKNCVCVDGSLLENSQNKTLTVQKNKYVKYDLFFAVTEHYLLLSECVPCKHYYEFYNDIDDEEESYETQSCIAIEDIGHCFSFTEIQNCTIKKAWGIASTCKITLKNGSIIKFMIPKFGGVGMFHHEEYKQKILERLQSYCKKD